MDRKQALKILELKTTDPSSEQIKKAYRKLSKKYHPDVNDDSDAAFKFLQISEAYNILYGKEDTGSYESVDDLRNFYAAECYQKEPLPKPGALVVTYGTKHIDRLKLPLECFILGDIFTFKLDVIKACSECYGNNDMWISCKICNQTGHTVVQSNTITGFSVSKCQQCKGHGWIRKSICDICHGKMKISFNRTVEITIPKGHNVGSTMTVRNQGNIGWNAPDGNLCLNPIPDFNLNNLDDNDVINLRSLLKKARK